MRKWLKLLLITKRYNAKKLIACKWFLVYSNEMKFSNTPISFDALDSIIYIHYQSISLIYCSVKEITFPASTDVAPGQSLFAFSGISFITFHSENKSGTLLEKRHLKRKNSLDNQNHFQIKVKAGIQPSKKS